MHPSTVVRRTDAGSAELATPAHGLSLTQRRFLTLLDTGRRLDEIAERHPAEGDKLERDLARLAMLGLVACDEPPPANDAMAMDAANEAMPQPAASVRLGMPRATKRVAVMGAILAAGAIAWAAWQQASPPERRDASGPETQVQSGASAPAADAVTVDAQPIATRVLRSNPSDRTRDAGKDAHAQPKRTQPKDVEAPAQPLPVEHRSPAREDPLDVTLTRAPMPVLPMPGPALLPMPVEAVRPSPAASAPSPSAAASSISAASAPSPSTAANPAASNASMHPSASPSPLQIEAGTTTSAMRLASIAAQAPSRRPDPPAALVPIARETPSFPREAIAAGLDSGIVKARLTVGASGNVESVDIVTASHRSFNRAVRDALVHWRFEPGPPGRTTVVDVAFKRD